MIDGWIRSLHKTHIMCRFQSIMVKFGQHSNASMMHIVLHPGRSLVVGVPTKPSRSQNPHVCRGVTVRWLVLLGEYNYIRRYTLCDYMKYTGGAK